MKVFIIGNGGREHCIAWKVAQSEQVSEVWVAPGNAGTAMEPKTQNINITAMDIEKLVIFAKQQKIDLTIVGPEAAIAAGIADQFEAAGLPIFAPSQAAARLESSKDFSKAFMIEHHIPTATYASFSKLNPAIAYLEQQAFPIVIKADGLAAGKGVVIAETLAEARNTVTDMLSGNCFGEAGHCVVIEEFLHGTEMSYIVMADGTHILPLASSKDHKRLENGDIGPNTGGMGAVSPSPLLTQELEKTILETIIRPAIEGMQAKGTPFTGFLYAGLMIDEHNQPKVLEFNCRLGDPETQVIIPRLKTDLATICLAATQHKLDTIEADWFPQHTITVVMASGGYPTTYHVGDEIKGLDKQLGTGIKVFHAGTKLKAHKCVTNGGRVLSVTGLAETLQLAYDKAYSAVEKISWHNCCYRTDIGVLCMKPA